MLAELCLCCGVRRDRAPSWRVKSEGGGSCKTPSPPHGSKETPGTEARPTTGFGAVGPPSAAGAGGFARASALRGKSRHSTIEAVLPLSLAASLPFFRSPEAVTPTTPPVGGWRDDSRPLAGVGKEPMQFLVGVGGGTHRRLGYYGVAGRCALIPGLTGEPSGRHRGRPSCACIDCRNLGGLA